ncbi:SDR family oxidoreductase [Halopseudomonas pachastrellae]|nr:SDR family oxidoreductase [Halopseudomonas pachastrellae]
MLVCNAATNPVYGPTHKVSDEAFDKIMGTKRQGHLLAVQHGYPAHDRARRRFYRAAVEHCGSACQRQHRSTACPKAAEAGLARNLSLEWGPQGIRVNSIAPGLIRTDFAQALLEDPDRLRKVEEKLPLRRVGEPVDIAGVALFLASSASAYVTGQTIVADGGDTIA